MAVAILNPRIEINGVDMSSNIQEITLDEGYETLEVQTFGDSAKEYIAGLFSGSLKLKFVNDFTYQSVEYTLWNLRGSVVAVKVRHSTANTGSSNPEYSFNVLVSQHVPYNGAVGDLETVDVTWPISGAVSRALA